MIAYLQNGIERSENNEKRLRHLLSYTEEAHQFTKKESEQLISAIDACKILDPACGSGAFPMGVLQKLDAILNHHDGPDRIEFELTVSGRSVRVANRKHRVEWDDQLAEELRATLGSVRVQVSEPIAS